MAIESDDPATGELPRVSSDDTGGPPRPRRFRPFRFTLKLMLFVAIVYFAMVTIVPGVRKATQQLSDVNPALLGLGLALELTALLAYTLLTRAALGDEAHKISRARLYRIQLSTKALSSIVPGGSAAGSALGYRLMTLSGVNGPDAGFALATAGLGSAVVLNLLFWIALMVSIPIRGVNPGYAVAAVAGVVLMLIASGIVFGLMEGQGRAERVVRWAARHLRMNEDRTAAGVRHIGVRLEDLASDRRLLARVLGWAAANWMLDAAALWVFLRAFGASTDLDALIVAFGLVNVLAVIPITPGGLGIIDGGLPLALVGFGLPRSTAVARCRPRIASPSSSSRSCSVGSCTPACVSGRGASNGANACAACATSRPIHRTTNVPSTSLFGSPNGVGRPPKRRRPIRLWPARRWVSPSMSRRSRVTTTTTASYCRSHDLS